MVKSGLGDADSDYEGNVLHFILQHSMLSSLTACWCGALCCHVVCKHMHVHLLAVRHVAADFPPAHSLGFQSMLLTYSHQEGACMLPAFLLDSSAAVSAVQCS